MNRSLTNNTFILCPFESLRLLSEVAGRFQDSGILVFAGFKCYSGQLHYKLFKMPIPLAKAGITAIRYLMRPINNMIIKKFKTMDKDSRGYLFFVNFGQRSNRFEIKMNRMLLGTKGLGEIKDIHIDMAFNKGVEWFTEVFVFYGILFLIAGYELNKASVSAQATKDKIESLTLFSKAQQLRIDELKI